MSKKKTKKKTKKKAETKKLGSAVEMGDFFNVSAQKFRVVDMDKPFPRDNADEIIPMTPQEIVTHCQGVSGCGQLMRMKFKANPDKASYKPKAKKKGG